MQSAHTRSAKAVRDDDYMLGCKGRPRDNCVSIGERSVDRYIQRRIIDQISGGSDRLGRLAKAKQRGPWGNVSLLMEETREMWRKMFQDRFPLAMLERLRY